MFGRLALRERCYVEMPLIALLIESLVVWKGIVPGLTTLQDRTESIRGEGEAGGGGDPLL